VGDDGFVRMGSRHSSVDPVLSKHLVFRRGISLSLRLRSYVYTVCLIIFAVGQIIELRMKG
jgi:hypothetical protein